MQHNTAIKERIDTAPPKMAESLGALQLCTARAAPILSGSFLSSIAWRRVARLRLALILAGCRLDASFGWARPVQVQAGGGYLTGGFCMPRTSPLPLACARSGSFSAALLVPYH